MAYWWIIKNSDEDKKYMICLNHLFKYNLDANEFEWEWLLEKIVYWKNTILNKQSNQTR